MRELKKEARAILKERFGLTMLGFFLAYIIPTLFSVILNVAGFVTGQRYVVLDFLLIIAVSGTVIIGKNIFALNLAERNGKASLVNLISGAKIFYKPLAAMLLIYLAIIVSCFVFYIPYGILLGTTDSVLNLIGSLILMAIIVFILSIFSQTFYIMAENREKGIIECLRESKDLMKGNKLRYLGLLLIFLLCIFAIIIIMGIVSWGLVHIIDVGIVPFIFVIITVGLLFLVYPYMELILTLFYLKIKKEKNDEFDNVNEVNYIADQE